MGGMEAAVISLNWLRVNDLLYLFHRVIGHSHSSSPKGKLLEGSIS